MYTHIQTTVICGQVLGDWPLIFALEMGLAPDKIWRQECWSLKKLQGSPDNAVIPRSEMPLREFPGACLSNPDPGELMKSGPGNERTSE